MRLGDESLELTQYLAAPPRPIPADSRSHDHWFQHVAIIVSDMDAAYARLRAHQVQHVSPSPQRLPDWNPSAGGIRAFYFKDPDGHPLEILWFPGGKGDPRWRRPDGRLFLGIDHTAIVVADTDRSLACYRDALGLRVAGESRNHGPEQERLNDVPGARLRSRRSGPRPVLASSYWSTSRHETGGPRQPARARATSRTGRRPRRCRRRRRARGDGQPRLRDIVPRDGRAGGARAEPRTRYADPRRTGTPFTWCSPDAATPEQPQHPRS